MDTADAFRHSLALLVRRGDLRSPSLWEVTAKRLPRPQWLSMDTADTFRRSLGAVSKEELKTMQERLHRAYELRFKRR